MPQTNQIDNQQQVDTTSSTTTTTTLNTQGSQQNTVDTQTQQSVQTQQTIDNQQQTTTQQPNAPQQTTDTQNANQQTQTQGQTQGVDNQTQPQGVDTQNQNNQQTTTTNEPITFEAYIVKGNGEVSIVGSDLVFQAKREERDTTSTIAVQSVRGNLKSVPVEIDVSIISTFLKVFPTELQTIERGLSQQFDIQTDALDYEITATPDTNVLIDKQKKNS